MITSMRLPLALALVLVLVRSTHAQDEALDADPRPYDKVWVRGMEGPIEGTILEGAEAGSAMLKLKKKGETVTFDVERDKVERIVPKQTPSDAFKERAERIKAGTAAEHRTLGDWAWKSGLEVEATAELEKAVLASSDPAASVAQRGRLARVLLLRAAKATSEDERDDLHEKIVATFHAAEKAKALSAEVELAIGRVLLTQGVPSLALSHLEKARDELAAALGGSPLPGPPPASGGREGQNAPPKDLKQEQPRPTRRGDRDGAGGPRDKGPAAPPPEERPAADLSAEKWPGLDAERRQVYRETLVALAEAFVKLERPDAATRALDPLVEAFPQDRTGVSLRARARLLSGDGRGAADDLTILVKAASEPDAALLRDRGIAWYACGELDAAKDDLDRALAGNLEDPRPARAHLGLVHLRAGRFQAAETELRKADEGGYGLAKLGLGVLAELRGKPDEAAALYEEARTLVDAQDASFVSYSVALARARAKRHDEARSAIVSSLREGLPFPVGARSLAAIARAQGKAKDEVRALEELVAATDPAQPDDLYALGRAYVTVDRLEDARLTFDRAIATVATHVPSLLGAGYVRYAKDDRDGARDAFEKALALDKDSAFARRALKNLEDARTRKVWIDRFDREDGDVKNGWVTEKDHGVDVVVKGGHLVFEGKQARDDGAKTKVAREISNQQVVKLEVRLDASLAGKARAGIRFETDKGSVILFRNDDGSLQAAVSTGGPQGYADPVKIGTFPEDTRPHVFAIEIEDPNQGVVSLWLDGERQGDVKVLGIGRATKTTVAVFGAAALDVAYGLTVDEVRIYARRPDAPAKSGGF